MRIAILGAGNVGGALAAAAVAAGHEVTISAATPEHAQAAAENAGAGARSAASNAEAVRDAELVVLAVPGSAVPGIAAELGEALSGAVVSTPPTR
ncbi:MAG TPA: NAD(P)-binding domain-containing protein [Jiangellaceae bacterium]